MKIGLVGLPKSGKTSLFNLLTGASVATSSYGGSRAEMHSGVARVPDERVDRLTPLFKPKKTTFASFEVVDLAGITKGDREGLDAKEFRSADALLHVVRAFSDRFRQWRMGFSERKVKPRMARASSSERSAARMGVSDSSAGLRRSRMACSLTSASVRFFLMEASRRSSRRSTTSRSARISSVSRSPMSPFGLGAVPAGSGKARTTCRSASAFLNSLASSPSRSPLVIPARSTTSNDAKAVFFGLKSALSLSTLSSGTRATPECISAREPPYDEVATDAPVSRLNSEVLPLLGSPTRPIFMKAHATIARPVLEHRSLDLKGAALALLLSALWGANPVAIKLGLADVAPLQMALLRFTVSALAIFAFAMASGRRDVLVIRSGEAKPIWALGLLFVLQIALMNLGLELTTAAHGVIVLNSYAIHTVVFAHFMIPGDQLTPRKLAGVLVAYGGVIILFARGFTTSSGTFAGDLIVALSAVLLGERIVYIAKTVRRVDPVRLMLYQSIIGSVGFFLISFAMEAGRPTRWTSTLILSILFQGVVIGGFNFVTNAWLLKIYRPSALSTVALTTPIWGVLIAAAIGGEGLAPEIILSTLLVVVGIALTMLR